MKLEDQDVGWSSRTGLLIATVNVSLAIYPRFTNSEQVGCCPIEKSNSFVAKDIVVKRNITNKI